VTGHDLFDAQPKLNPRQTGWHHLPHRMMIGNKLMAWPRHSKTENWGKLSQLKAVIDGFVLETSIDASNTVTS